jgi:hypothetical protein
LAIKDFLKGTLRVAIAMFIALVGLAAVVAIYVHMKESRERDAAKPFEEVRNWQFDLKDQLGADVRTKTKLVAGKLLVSIDVVGHSKYFSDPRNQGGSLDFEFIDKDGFKVASHAVKISEFATTVGKSGEPIGLQHQYEEYLELERYRQFSRMQVGWNLVTEPRPATDAQAAKPILDHCAPNLSKAERLKRLAQHGSLRETGTGSYSAGGHSVTFFEYDGSLLNCR